LGNKLRETQMWKNFLSLKKTSKEKEGIPKKEYNLLREFFPTQFPFAL